MRSALTISFLFLVSSCINSELNVTDISKLIGSNASSVEDIAVQEFALACLPNGGRPRHYLGIGADNVWQIAANTTLNELGLARLRKKVLEIPGGGGHFKESQTVYANTSNSEPLILNLETRFERNRLTDSKCEIYINSELISTCTALGKLVGKPPDRNLKYAHNQAHFISWNLLVDQAPAHLVCKRTPESKVLPYEGISITLSTDMRRQAQPKPQAVSSH